MEEKPELVRNDPESEASVDLMVAILAEELFVRASMGDQVATKEDATHVAEIAADALLDRFVVRPREPGKARYSWRR
jgi:hypothetical protein